ncbi:MAG: DNA-3-methyladenine glycosylase [Bacteroidales bacterium]
MRPGRDFFKQDVLTVAPLLLGKYIVTLNNGITEKFIITEVEAYRGEEDLACHASKGRTKRNGIMYAEGGHIYVYFIYGMYWMLNIVTGEKDNPQAVLIRGINRFDGPGKLTRRLKIDGSFYGEDLVASNRIWIENNMARGEIVTGPRIGIDYAGDYWKNMPWRYNLLLQK